MPEVGDKLGEVHWHLYWDLLVGNPENVLGTRNSLEYCCPTVAAMISLENRNFQLGRGEAGRGLLDRIA